MRRYIKKYLKGITKSLFDANQLLRKLVIKGNEDKINVLLQDMQAVAIEAGEIIEQHQGDGGETVHLLEELCELIWEISQLPMNEKDRMCKMMQKKLKLIQGQIEEFSERLEVVFLPYKASMWDSLESVWKAADEAPDCDAYVIPIPYYDKNPDGSFGQLHYEGDQYPSYVPITDFQKYDFEKRHPDKIFIHNPYDDCNYVTSVHPFFYSVNLKKYTEQLIYIPYFITMGGIGEHLCTLPACFYADKIFVESERVKTIYIEKCSENDEEMSKFYEKKLEVLGSPKIDKIFHLDCYSKTSEGLAENKKIILFNSSLSGLMKNPEKWIDRLQMIFKLFKKEKEVLIWWRPHPLTCATIESMFMMYKKRYQEVVDEFIGQQIGIYDNSPDMYKAIALSDGYYGDRSSIVQLYGITGKPILLEDFLSNFETLLSPENYSGEYTKIYAINNRDNARIHEFLMNEKCVTLPCFINYIISQAENQKYKERVKKQSLCYKNSMVCNEGNTGYRIWKFLTEEFVKE